MRPALVLHNCAIFVCLTENGYYHYYIIYQVLRGSRHVTNRVRQVSAWKSSQYKQLGDSGKGNSMQVNCPLFPPPSSLLSVWKLLQQWRLKQKVTRQS